MGASVSIHWPGIADEQLDGDIGFVNDDRAWANWICELAGNRSLQGLMDRLGVAALRTHTTDGMADSNVRWVSPQELADAAWTLIRLIESTDPRIGPLITAYAKGANKVDPVEEELARDLSDVILRTQYAQAQGVPRMTLYIGW